MNRAFHSEHTGWRSRLYIPHFDQPDLIQLITIRLYDAIPEGLVDKWKKELNWVQKMSANDPRQITLRKRIDKYEDAGYGACWLRDDQVASIVEEALLHFDAKLYRIIAWCIMPNHVHILIEIWKDLSLDKILHSWKSYTAHEANRVLHRSGAFWFREYHDRYVRNDRHLADAVEYVENNPVKAGLIRKKEEWKWSSARLLDAAK